VRTLIDRRTMVRELVAAFGASHPAAVSGVERGSVTEKQNLDLFLLRYLPNVVRGEFVNFGAVLVKEGGEVSGFRFAQDWRRIQCLFPDTDVDLLQAMQVHLQNELREGAKWNEFCRIFNNYVSSGFDLALPKGVVTNDVAKELEIISKLYFESLRLKPVTKGTGRSAILAVMEQEFDQAGILKLLQQRTRVAPYTVPEDPLTIDYLYHVGDVVKMFQAISISRQGESAVGFAYRCPKIAAGLREQQKVLVMTAVVDAHDPNEQNVAYALQILQEANVYVAPVSEMRAIAETARVELHA
jgi:hypothetical protein